MLASLLVLLIAIVFSAGIIAVVVFISASKKKDIERPSLDDTQNKFISQYGGKCPECGTNIDENLTYCPKCGLKLKS